MERGNFSAAAGFGFDSEKFGVFSTFSAFLEMIISELTMARLNNCNVLSHFSHSGIDEIADNTCHFGINSFFADNGLSDVHSWLYFPADAAQMHAVVDKVFFQRGVRFIFSTRSKLPWILKEDGSRFFEGDYKFEPGKDDVILEGTDGYVVSFGDMLHRSYDAVLRVRQKGLNVGLINKSTLNVVDEDVLRKIGSTKFVLVTESWNQKTGLGSKMGTWFLERGLTPKYGYMGTTKEGCGGLAEQIYHQGLDPESAFTNPLRYHIAHLSLDYLHRHHHQDRQARAVIVFAFRAPSRPRDCKIAADEIETCTSCSAVDGITRLDSFTDRCQYESNLGDRKCLRRN